jgi:3-oxoacyl-ACP reductase-like protein
MRRQAVQNEILGDLQKEISGGVPVGAGELSQKALSSKFSGSTSGKLMNDLIKKVVASKMPGGFAMTSIMGVPQR